MQSTIERSSSAVELEMSPYCSRWPQRHCTLPNSRRRRRCEARLQAGPAYAACSSGASRSCRKTPPTSFGKLKIFPFKSWLHPLAVDPATHRVDAPEQEQDGQSVARIVVYEPTKK